MFRSDRVKGKTEAPNGIETVVIQLPFEGFYCSKWDGEIDSIHEREAEWLEEEEGEPLDDGTIRPKELRLNASEFGELLFNWTDHSSIYLDVAKLYVEAFNDEMTELLSEYGGDLRLTFESMSSPREYNFATDRIFAHIPMSSVKRLFELSEDTNHAGLRVILKESHTSRDGFISFYSNDLDEWLAKPIEDWDYNELGSLLLAVMYGYCDAGEEDGNALSWRIYERIVDCEGLYHVHSQAVDWPKFEAAVEEARADKLEALREAYPEHPLVAVSDGNSPEPRCPNTKEMFPE